MVRSFVYEGVASLERGRRERDELPTTVHCGVRVDGHIVAVGTINRDASPRNDHTPVWRIRGMATLPDHQGHGYGGLLLRHLVEHIASNGGGLLWGDLRVDAVAFYQRHGFQVQEDTYLSAQGVPHRYGETRISARS